MIKMLNESKWLRVFVVIGVVALMVSVGRYHVHTQKVVQERLNTSTLPDVCSQCFADKE